MNSNLLGRLKSLGVVLGAKEIQVAREIKIPIEKVIEGDLFTSPAGEVFCAHRLFKPDHRHGSIGFDQHPGYDFFDVYNHLPEGLFGNPQDVVFIDTETTGLAGGTGTLAFMIGAGYFRDDGFHVDQFFLRSPSEELPNLTIFSNLVESFKIIVSFNGKGFDVPLLKTRYTLNRLEHPFDNRFHFDLLPLARRIWRNRLPSRALKDLESAILGVDRTIEEVPGWMIPQMYFDYLRSGDARPMAGIFYHNAMDIASLAALFMFLGSFLNDPTGQTDPEISDLLAVAGIYEDLGKHEEALSMYSSCIRVGMDDQLRSESLLRQAGILQKLKDLPHTIEVLEFAAADGEFEACVRLAMILEHKVRDIDRALHWTEKAIVFCEITTHPTRASVRELHELEHRKYRLLHKKESKNPHGD